MQNFQKFFISLFVFSFISLSLSAQYGPQFDNRGFEQWTNRVTEPTHWHSGGTATGFYSWALTNQIEQSSHPRPNSSGSKSVRLFPHSTWGVLANGNITNGRMNAGSSSSTGADNYNYTQRSESAYNTPINQLPDSLSIWVCFRCTSTSEQAQVKAVVHGDADYKIIANGTEEPANMHVATAVQSFTRTAPNGGSYTWRRLSIPFNNNGPCTDVRYILMTATTNATPGSGNSNDDLFLDDLLLIYNPTLTMGQLASNSFSPGDAITIPFTLSGTMSPENLDKAANEVIAQLSDANGNFTPPTELGRVTTNTSGSITAQIPNVTAGNGYRIRVISTNYPMVGGNIQTVSIAPSTYTITVAANPSNGGTVTGGGTYNNGQSCTVTATPNTGYTFVNWTENGTQVSTSASYTFTVSGNRSLVANFTENTYNVTVSANPNNGGTASGGGTFTHGQNCTVNATANTGYTFTNWTENGSVVSTQASYTFSVTGDRNLVANFTENTYTVTVSANPNNGGTASGGGTFTHGQSCTVTATANTGYTFNNWTENGSVVSSNASYTFSVSNNRTLVANFTINSYTITATADPSNGGTVAGTGTYTHGQNCTLTATASTGYTFTNWTENGNVVSTNASYSFAVDGDRSLVAHFSVNSYTITATVDPSNGGTVSGSGTYTYGQSCTLTVVPSIGYTFINWTENGTQVSSQATYTFTVTGNRNLVAHLSSQSYIITATTDPAEGGVVTGSGGYDYGDECTLTATANEGYTFVNWTKDGSLVTTEPTYTFNVTESETYVAHFTINSYEITVTADPSEGGIVTGAGEYEHGASCTLTAEANENYDFFNWTKDGIEVSTEATFTFTVTASADYVAHFRYDDDVEEHSATSQIFPNPFSSTLSITTEKAMKRISVYDVNGRLVKEQDVADTHVELDLSGFNAGTYLLQVDYGDSRSVHRIMKAK